MPRDVTAFGTFVVVFEKRSDGGLRVYSDDVPGFVLSHSDRALVLSDVRPALETIIGEMVGERVSVQPLEISQSPLPWFKDRQRETQNFRIVRAA